MTSDAQPVHRRTPRPGTFVGPAAVALLLLGAIVHLVGLAHPRSVVFDEVHFGSYANAYCCTGEYFFDIHPPHAKLLIAGTARSFGYAGDVSFASIGKPFGPVSPIPLRLAPAVAGSLLPLLVFALLRQLRATPAAAFLGGLLVVFDNAFVLQSRVIALDIVLLACVVAALVAYLAAEDATTPAGRERWSLVSGGLAGFAVGSKFLGLGVVALVVLGLFRQGARDPGRANIVRVARQAAWFFLGAGIVYAAGWVLHFELLSRPGPGDIWGRPTGALFTDIVEVHRRMLSANLTMTHTHPDASPWWAWPLMHKPIFYWAATDSAAKMYLVGNPVVWLGGSLAFAAALLHLALFPAARLRAAMRASGAGARIWLPLAGFFVFYVPLVAVTRPLFTYHYFLPLLFSLVVVVLWLDHLGVLSPGRHAGRRAGLLVAVVLLVLGFAAMAPVTFGTETGAHMAEGIVRLFRGGS